MILYYHKHKDKNSCLSLFVKNRQEDIEKNCSRYTKHTEESDEQDCTND